MGEPGMYHKLWIIVALGLAIGIESDCSRFVGSGRLYGCECLVQEFNAVDPVPTSIDFSSKIKLKTEIDKIQEASAFECVLDLGKQLCNSEIAIQWTICNHSAVPIDLPRMTVSCGCITGVPSNLAIASGETVELLLRVVMPRQQEDLKKQIVFWDERGNARFQANVKSTVMLPMELEHKVVSIDREEKHSITIPVRATNKGIELNKLRIKTYGAEVVESELHSIDGQSGSLRIEVDPKNTSEPTIRSTFIVEVTEANGKSSSLSLPVTFVNRTITEPSKLFFQKTSKQCNAKLRVRSIRFSAELMKGNSLSIEKKDSLGKWSPIPCELTLEPEAKTGPMRVLQINLTLETLQSLRVSEPLLLRCGPWEHKLDWAVD
jgi:hypothetical protein